MDIKTIPKRTNNDFLNSFRFDSVIAFLTSVLEGVLFGKIQWFCWFRHEELDNKEYSQEVIDDEKDNHNDDVQMSESVFQKVSMNLKPPYQKQNKLSNLFQ